MKEIFERIAGIIKELDSVLVDVQGKQVTLVSDLQKTRKIQDDNFKTLNELNQREAGIKKVESVVVLNENTIALKKEAEAEVEKSVKEKESTKAMLFAAETKKNDAIALENNVSKREKKLREDRDALEKEKLTYKDEIRKQIAGNIK